MQSVSLLDAGPITLDIARAVVAAQDRLSEIDAATGDGDHGINMAKGFRLVLERLGDGPFDLAHGFATIGDTLLGDIGGSMGPLYGSFFTEMSDTIDGSDALDRDGFLRMLRAGEAAIVDLGEAKPGDKTLIDVLTPSGQAFGRAAEAGADFAACLAALRDAAAGGLEARPAHQPPHRRARPRGPPARRGGGCTRLTPAARSRCRRWPPAACPAGPMSVATPPRWRAAPAPGCCTWTCAAPRTRASSRPPRAAR